MRTFCLALVLCGVLATAVTMTAQSPQRADYDFAYLGAPLPDPVIQHSKETYVLFGCAYCHGLDLTPHGEATDLRRSPLVGADRNANLIGPLLRAGIPQTAKLSPMPQFSDLSEQQIGAIARWIHYARARARFRELSESKGTPGDAAAGRAYFDTSCSSCHAADRDLAGVGAKYTRAALRTQILEPSRLASARSYEVTHLHDARVNSGRERHQSLLENYSAADVDNLVAFLQAVPATRP
jgi:mono/diheme cytochrome c family protein